MPFGPLALVAFVAGVLLVYYPLPTRAQNYWLLLASYVFCVAWSPWFALLLAALTLANYIIARGMGARGPERHPPRETARRRWLWLGIGINVAALLAFKYADWYVADLAELLRRSGLPVAIDALQLLIPLGLSFYSLQAISYLVDVSRGQLAPETDLGVWALYMAYWPKLVAGPIERARAFLPALKQPRVVDNELAARSLALIVAGLWRKLVVADTLAAMIPANAFSPGASPGWNGILWLAAYYFFLYNDFAGYTSIVRGVSGLFGIELSANFAAPFFARSFSEYWTRWHITLSNWLRDYIFMPLSRGLLRRNPSPHNLANLALPPVLTMLASGVWHGGTPNMLLWGGLHGLYLMVERIPAFWRPHVPMHSRSPYRQGLGMLVVFGLTLVALVPFVMDIQAVPAFWGELLQVDRAFVMDWRVAVLVLSSLTLDWAQYHFKDEVVFLRLPLPARASLLAGALIVMFLLTRSDTGVPFVYRGF